MENKLMDKHQKESEEMNKLFRDKTSFFKNKRSELDMLDNQMRDRHRNEMSN